MAVVGLAVAVLVGVIVVVVNATIDAPGPVVAASMTAVILFGTIGFIWAIVAVSTPRVPPVAAGTPLLNVHRAKLRPWLWRLLVFVAALVVLEIALPGDAKDVAGIFGLMFGGLAIVLMFTLYLAARGMDRSLTSVEANPWAHWHYSPAAWSAWTGELVARAEAAPRTWTWSRDWKRLAVPMLAISVAIVVFDAPFVPLSFLVPFVVAVWVLMIGIIELSEWSARTAPRRLRHALLGAPPDTYLGPAGVFADGTYNQWLTASSFLVEAAVDERAPRSIVLRFSRYAAGTSAPTEIVQNVLIPPDADADLARLQSALGAACPAATVTLAK